MDGQDLIKLHLELAEECYKEGNFKDAKEIIAELLTYPNTSSNHYKISILLHAYRLHYAIVKGKTHYEILRIEDVNSSLEVIERNYMDMKLMLNPKKINSVAVKNALEIVESAWEVLSDSVKRRVYDNELGVRKRIRSFEEYGVEKKKLKKQSDDDEIIQISDSHSDTNYVSDSDSG